MMAPPEGPEREPACPALCGAPPCTNLIKQAQMTKRMEPKIRYLTAAQSSAFACSVLVLIVSLLAMAGCAATSPTAARDALIQQRAQARWDAILARDYATAYSYATPGYRSATSATDFEIDLRSRRVQYTSADYKDHSCQEAACTVSMSVGYKVVRPVAGLSEWNGKSVVEEQWVFSKGEWWFLPEK